MYHQNLLFNLNKQFDNQNNIKDFLELCKNFDYIFTITTPKKTIRKSPEPLTTSTLQQLASNELHMSPKETMKYAQQLYEGGYITYMRTDSNKYCKEFIDSVKKMITNVYGEEYINKTVELINNTGIIDNYKKIIHTKFVELMNPIEFMKTYENTLVDLYSRHI